MINLEDYHAMFLASPDGYLVVDGDGRIREANPKAEALFGWSREELIGTAVDILVPEASRGDHGGHRDSFMRQPRDRPMGAGLELRGRRKDGTTFPVEISLSPWDRETERGGMRVICAVRDMSDHRRLRDFSESALRATEDERRRIARELHDDTAQRLATLILQVRRLVDADDPEARRALVEEIREEIIETSEDIKRIARGLRPPELEEVGLALAVRAHVRLLRERMDFDVDADLDDVDGGLDLAGKLALYRIIQQALSNARRHADAPSTRLRLYQADGFAVAEVQDDGRGFDPEYSMQLDRGLGLVGMRERATMVGGRFAIESTPGEGTLVRAAIPLCMEEHHGGAS